MAQNKIFHGEPQDVETMLNNFEKDMGNKIENVTRVIASSNTPGCIIVMISYDLSKKYKV